MYRVAGAICLVFLGCCLNVLVLEQLTNNINDIANLITFFQFVFIALEGFIFTAKFGNRKPAVPVTKCSLLIVLFFISSVCNNYAYNFNVPTTLHIIIKSGSLVTNMAAGIVIGKRKYTKEKYLGVSLVTVGIIMCTMTSARNFNDLPQATTDIAWWSVGIFLLVFALLVGAIMGMVQEDIYKTYGKHPHDVLYYTHILPLPLFIFLYNNLTSAFSHCFDIQSLKIPILDVHVSTWVLLLLSVLTQYICIRSVYILSSECSALTVNLILTLRKFISLCLSVIIFKNAFNLIHWFGTLFVFLGTLLYLEMIH